MNRVRAIEARLRRTRAFRSWSRYNDARGDLLAAGIGYYAFFSLFPALALGFAVFGFVLRGHERWLTTIAESLNETLPGFVRTPSNPGGLITLALPEPATLTITGVVALLTLLLSGLGWVGALRAGIRAIYQIAGTPASRDRPGRPDSPGTAGRNGNPVADKLRDLGVLSTLGVGVAVSAILVSAVGSVSGSIAAWLGFGESSLLVRAVGVVAGLLLDVLLMAGLLRFLSGAAPTWREVRGGALLGGTLLTLMKFFAAQLLTSATRSPLFGAIAAVVGLLFWLNLMARVVLFSAAWSATDAGGAVSELDRSVGVDPPSA